MNMEEEQNDNLSMLTPEGARGLIDELIELDEEAQNKRDKIKSLEDCAETIRKEVQRNGIGDANIKEEFISKMHGVTSTRIEKINSDLFRIQEIRQPLASKWERYLLISSQANKNIESSCLIKENKNKENPAEPISKCSCKRTQCLKMYCDCFSNSLFCHPSCTCQGCRNTTNHKVKVIDSREQVLIRKPEAFLAKDSMGFGITEDGVQLSKLGCKCRKTKCLKKYCVCFNNGRSCDDACVCVDCENTSGSPMLEYNSLDENCRIENSQNFKRIKLLRDPSDDFKVSSF